MSDGPERHIDAALASIDELLDHPTQKSDEGAYPSEFGEMTRFCWRCQRQRAVELTATELCVECAAWLRGESTLDPKALRRDGTLSDVELEALSRAARAWVEAYPEAAARIMAEIADGMQRLMNALAVPVQQTLDALAQVAASLGREDEIEAGPVDPVARARARGARQRAARERGLPAWQRQQWRQ